MVNSKHSQYQKHKKSYFFGIISEYVAIVFLTFKGYIILHRRYKTHVGEIDVIAKRGKTLAMVEVKARRDGITQIGEVVSNKQQKRIYRAASVFLSHTDPRYSNCSVRFDIIMIKPFCLPKHLQDAWRD